MTLARHSYNPQFGGSIGSGPVTITLFGHLQQSFHFQTLTFRRVCVPNDFEHSKGEKVYEHMNHLGNVLLVTTDLKLGQEIGSADDTTDFYLPEVVAASEDPEEYAGSYPGASPERGRSRRRMPMSGRTWQAGSYRYGFNGKESDDEWSGEGNSYSPIAMRGRARILDPRLGRWMSVDPKTWEFPHASPYPANGNNPILFILNGKQIYVSGNSEYEGEMLAALTRITGYQIEVEGGKLVAKGKIGGAKAYGNEILRLVQTKDVQQRIQMDDLQNGQTRASSYQESIDQGYQAFDEDLFSTADDLFIAQLFSHELTEQMSLTRRTDAENKKNPESKIEKKDVADYGIDHTQAYSMALGVAKTVMGVEFDINSAEEVQLSRKTFDDGSLEVRTGYIDREDRAIILVYKVNSDVETIGLSILFTRNFQQNSKWVDGRKFITGEQGEINTSFKKIE